MNDAFDRNIYRWQHFPFVFQQKENEKTVSLVKIEIYILFFKTFPLRKSLDSICCLFVLLSCFVGKRDKKQQFSPIGDSGLGSVEYRLESRDL